MTQVWDGLVRALHWALAIAVVAAWWTSGDASTPSHVRAGYAVAGLLGVRLLWGTIAGPRSARVSRCLRTARHALGYVRALRDQTERRYLGHNPLGSVMVLLLVACMAGVCLTGWLFTTDRFWGYGWLAALHEGFAWVLAGLVGLHVAGVLTSGYRHRENLVAAMLHGRKRRRAIRNENRS